MRNARGALGTAGQHSIAGAGYKPAGPHSVPLCEDVWCVALASIWSACFCDHTQDFLPVHLQQHLLPLSRNRGHGEPAKGPQPKCSVSYRHFSKSLPCQEGPVIITGNHNNQLLYSNLATTCIVVVLAR